MQDTNLDIFFTLLNKYRVLEMIQGAEKKGWDSLWPEFTRVYEQATFKNSMEKNIFVDLFFNQCLLAPTPAKTFASFWKIVGQWHSHRKLEQQGGALSANERTALLQFCLTLREKLRRYILDTPFEEVGELSDQQQRLVTGIWKLLFLEPFSSLNLYWNPRREYKEVRAECREAGYPGLLIASMFFPFAADEFAIDIDELIDSSLPFCYKFILVHWLVNTPYFNGEEKHRQKLLSAAPALCRAILRQPQKLTTLFFVMFVQEVMTGFWRISYIGGDNTKALSAFGDFISTVMNRSYSFPKPTLRKKSPGEKLRIGYISRNFYMQAVSLYMVNRVIHHTRDKFEVCIFALGNTHDTMSDLFQQHSDYFQHFPNLTDFSGMIKAILDQKLDILIYTDIGMDAVTYILSGLQLAPIQCAMVGHGTTTGMPTIQYYLSGDFEAPTAQAHYREKLVCLPRLGAAQYPVIIPEEGITRESLGIPTDATLFISCANGIKHSATRDALFVEILKQAPNAWIILKPFTTPAGIDYLAAGRLKKKAEAAGVGDRLIILPPIGQTSHVLGLLAIADVQLDSYPYGGWTTNMDCFYVGLPIITQEGELARSRWGAGMLRALGISEGIAANEEEYVQWAVTYARDRQLLQRVKARIKAAAKEVLFNGPTAQPAFEEALFHIYEEACLKEAESEFSPSEERTPPITVVTSLRPEDLETQRKAMASWYHAGFNVVSINALDDIPLLYPHFPHVTFVSAPRDGRDKFGQPYIYFDDILSYFKNREDRICGIISPDIFLTREDFLSYVRAEAADAVIYGSRADVTSLGDCGGEMYLNGFDYFFFDRKALDLYPRQDFCLGLPWFDYWTVLVPLMHKIPVKRVMQPVVQHVRHTPAGNPDIWHALGNALADNFHPPFNLTEETMVRYANETLTIIHELSEKVFL